MGTRPKTRFILLFLFFTAPSKARLAGKIDALNLLAPYFPEIHGYKMHLDRPN